MNARTRLEELAASIRVENIERATAALLPPVSFTMLRMCEVHGLERVTVETRGYLPLFVNGGVLGDVRN